MDQSKKDIETLFELADGFPPAAIIKVVGVGGGGGNAVEHMLSQNIEGVEFACANTDAQALRNSKARVLQLGMDITKGLGAGADPNVGREAAEADREIIKELLSGSDMVFITAGMGGGTGTGAAPVVAQIAKDLGILTVAVITKPFGFEGKRRMQVAENGIRELSQFVDSMITIPNDKLLSVLGRDITLLDAFKAANNVLYGAVQGIAELITRPGLINVDFADVRTVMKEMGMAVMGTGNAKGENRARLAIESAISSPLLEDININKARGILVNITGGLNMAIGEFETIGEIIKSFCDDDATVVVGTVIDPTMTDDIRVTVVLTGISNTNNTNKEMDKEKKLASEISDEPKSENFGDYRQFDRPTVMRNQNITSNITSKPTAVEKTHLESDIDYLDIPAFLRRKKGEENNEGEK